MACSSLSIIRSVSQWIRGNGDGRTLDVEWQGNENQDKTDQTEDGDKAVQDLLQGHFEKRKDVVNSVKR